MELSLIRNLMERDFYNNNKGTRCPDRLFTRDVQKIKHIIDDAMEKYDRSVSPEEVEALFLVANPTLTTAQKTVYNDTFSNLKKIPLMDSDIARDVLSTLFRQVVGEDVANLGFDFVNGDITTLEPLRNILDTYSDDFIPSVQVKWDTTDMVTVIKETSMEPQWNFNIRSLAKRVAGISKGQLVTVGARTNTGKTSFHASLVMSAGGFADQGARVGVLCNEESVNRVKSRYINASLGMMGTDILKNTDVNLATYKDKSRNVNIAEASNRNMDWVEAVCKSYKPDILILDVGDKFSKISSTMSTHELLKQNAIHARQIAKQHECVIFYMSQLSAEAEGHVVLDASMMEGSKTGKAAEADLILLLARNAITEVGKDEEDPERHITIAKNKLTGWHGVITCELDNKIALFTS